MTTQKNQPEATLRDGSLKATIWRNVTEKGHFFSVEFSRTYKQGEVFKDSHSFSGSEPLQVARLAQLAYERIVELRKLEAIHTAQIDEMAKTGAAQ